MSKSIIKLIDNSLIPAILIIISKFIGIYLSASFFQIKIQILTSPQKLFSISSFVSESDLSTISTYSDIIMFSFMVVGFLVVLIKSVYFHDTHIKVSTITKLAEMNKLKLIKSSYEIYHSGITWFIFIWLTVIIIFVNMIISSTAYWVFVLAFLFSIGLSVLLFYDLVKELDMAKNKLFKNQF